jgi:hypothetical protein
MCCSHHIGLKFYAKLAQCKTTCGNLLRGINTDEKTLRFTTKSKEKKKTKENKKALIKRTGVISPAKNIKIQKFLNKNSKLFKRVNKRNKISGRRLTKKGVNLKRTLKRSSQRPLKRNSNRNRKQSTKRRQRSERNSRKNSSGSKSNRKSNPKSKIKLP